MPKDSARHNGQSSVEVVGQGRHRESADSVAPGVSGTSSCGHVAGYGGVFHPPEMEIASLVISVLAFLTSGYAVRVARKDRTADLTFDAEERRLRAVRLAQSVGREIMVAQGAYKRWRSMGYRMNAEQQLAILATMEQARKDALAELEAMEVEGADRTELARLESSVIASLEHVQKMNEIIAQSDEKLEASRASDRPEGRGS